MNRKGPAAGRGSEGERPGDSTVVECGISQLCGSIPAPSAALAPPQRPAHPGGGLLVSGSGGGAAPRSTPAAPGGGPGRGRHRRGGLRPRWRRRAASPRFTRPRLSALRRGGAALPPRTPPLRLREGRGEPLSPPGWPRCRVSGAPPSPRGSCRGCGWAPWAPRSGARRPGSLRAPAEPGRGCAGARWKYFGNGAERCEEDERHGVSPAERRRSPGGSV